VFITQTPGVDQYWEVVSALSGTASGAKSTKIRSNRGSFDRGDLKEVAAHLAMELLAMCLCNQ